MSWLDFFRSLVNTRLCPFSFVEDTEDITSQLLSSLAGVDNTQLKLFVNEAELITRTELPHQTSMNSQLVEVFFRYPSRSGRTVV